MVEVPCNPRHPELSFSVNEEQTCGRNERELTGTRGFNSRRLHQLNKREDMARLVYGCARTPAVRDLFRAGSLMIKQGTHNPRSVGLIPTPPTIAFVDQLAESTDLKSVQ